MTAPQQQKLKITGPVVITGNRLGDGVVIYRKNDGNWSMRIDEAAITTKADEAGAWLALALSDGKRAIGAYIAPVTLGAGGRAEPGNLRERIRSSGPTVAIPT